MITEEQFKEWLGNPVTLKVGELLEVKKKEILEARGTLVEPLCHPDPVSRAMARNKAASLTECYRLIDSLSNLDYTFFEEIK